MHSLRQRKRHVGTSLRIVCATLAAFTGNHYVLPSSDGVDRRRGVGGIGQRCLPEHFTGRFVECTQLTVVVCGGDEYEPACRYDWTAVALAACILLPLRSQFRILSE